MTLGITTICHYVQLCYAECQVLFIVMMTVIMLSLIIISRKAHYAECRFISTLSVVRMNVIMLSVVEPIFCCNVKQYCTQAKNLFTNSSQYLYGPNI
jgi:hypothetical protein